MINSELENTEAPEPSASRAEQEKDYAEFEIGQHKVPWFLWLFFALIVSWASISWIKFFGY